VCCVRWIEERHALIVSRSGACRFSIGSYRRYRAAGAERESIILKLGQQAPDPLADGVRTTLDRCLRPTLTLHRRLSLWPETKRCALPLGQLTSPGWGDVEDGAR
jgi:hypothetical protein